MIEGLSYDPEQKPADVGAEVTSVNKTEEPTADAHTDAERAKDYIKFLEAGEVFYQFITQPSQPTIWSEVVAKQAPSESAIGFNREQVRALLRPFYEKPMTPERAQQIAQYFQQRLVDNQDK